MNNPCVAIGALLQSDGRPFSRESKIAGKKNPTNPIAVGRFHERGAPEW
jgi:hypothetical protein